MSDEETTGEPKSHQTPRDPVPDFPVAAIGASAGGLETARTFFKRLPADPDIGFVLIMHLPPERESHLAEVLQTVAQVPVHEVTDPVELRPNHLYVISPGRPLTFENGRLVPQEGASEPGAEAVIDRLFRSMAENWQERAIGVVLSGTGTDGTLGIRAIREANGLTMAQAPEEAEFPSMPAHAIDTGQVDIVAPVGELAERLLRVRAAMDQMLVPAHQASLENTEAELLEQILARLHAETGHDFSGYKRSTVLRRVSRRMQTNDTVSLEEYLSLLRERPSEARTLFRDLLISVTNFFRDPEAYEMLAREVLPQMLAEKEEGEQLRVWVAGCATGEEAYSLAMLIEEAANDLDRHPEVQIFATDVDERAITTAREGIYPDSITVDVSEKRLERFFIRENNHFRVRKSLKDHVLFASHNLLRDAPFSNIDLVSCRNLLIYLQRERQKPAFEMFHFALRPGGILFLGTSESADGVSELFMPLDKKHSIYRRRGGESHPHQFSNMLVAEKSRMPETDRGEARSSDAAESYAEQHRELLYRQCVPTSILVRADHSIVHVAREGSPYLQYPEGEPPHTAVDIVIRELQSNVRSALFQLFKKSQPTDKTVQIGENGQRVRLTVTPVDFGENLGRVQIEPIEKPSQQPSDVFEYSEESDDLVQQLEEELEEKETQLQTTIEEYETSTEELRASNEELMSMNEELQSTTEELETSREELQSMNEELSTVNDELERKVEELEHANSDLENFIAASDLRTIFLDREFRLRRYTPRTTDLFNVIDADIGRSITHITHKLRYEGLLGDAREVFQKHITIEREVRATDGGWYIMRVRPYRTVEDRVEGVVLSFFDITRRKEAEQQLRRREERYRSLFESMGEGFCILEVLFDDDGAPVDYRFVETNPAFEEQTGLSDAEGQRMRELAPEHEQHWFETYGRIARTGKPERFIEEAKELGGRWYDVCAFRIGRPEDRRVAVLFNDITKRKRAEEELRQLNAELEERVDERTRQLEQANEELRRQIDERERLEQEVLEVSEQERWRIGEGLHEEAGQALTGIHMLLGEHIRQLEEKGFEDVSEARRIRELIKEVDDQLRDLARGIIPLKVGEAETLRRALEGLAEETQERFDMECRVDIAADLSFGSDERATHVYRIVQEALHNAALHGEASQVTIELRDTREERVLTITDNGIGPDEDVDEMGPQGIGLRLMQYRCHLLRGRFSLEEPEGGGLRVTCRFPQTDASSS